MERVATAGQPALRRVHDLEVVLHLIRCALHRQLIGGQHGAVVLRPGAIANEVHRGEGLGPRAPVEQPCPRAQRHVAQRGLHPHRLPGRGVRDGVHLQGDGVDAAVLQVLLQLREQGANLGGRGAGQLEVRPGLEQLLVGPPRQGLVPHVEGGESLEAVELHQLVVRDVGGIQPALHHGQRLLEAPGLQQLARLGDGGAGRSQLEEGRRGKGRTGLGRQGERQPESRDAECAPPTSGGGAHQKETYQSGVEGIHATQCRRPFGGGGAVWRSR
ncbi:hypothetical protein COSO111634_24165 [Corallococcus soli]